MVQWSKYSSFPNDLALLDCVNRVHAAARASVFSSIKPVFSETVEQVNTKFGEKVVIHNIPMHHLFLFFWILIFKKI